MEVEVLSVTAVRGPAPGDAGGAGAGRRFTKIARADMRCLCSGLSVL